MFTLNLSGLGQSLFKSIHYHIQQTIMIYQHQHLQHVSVILYNILTCIDKDLQNEFFINFAKLLLQANQIQLVKLNTGDYMPKHLQYDNVEHLQAENSKIIHFTYQIAKIQESKRPIWRWQKIRYYNTQRQNSRIYKPNM